MKKIQKIKTEKYAVLS